MPLLNYTTRIPVSKTIGEIQALLADKGASAIVVQYANRQPIGMSFVIETPAGEREFVLPARVDGVLARLRDLQRRGKFQSMRKGPDHFANPEHAACVAWRILKDWVEAQMAIVEVGMASLDQVMLPYMLVGHDQSGRPLSLYERFRADRALPGG